MRPIITLLIVLCFTVNSFGQDYEIKLDRPFPEDIKFRMVASQTSFTSIKISSNDKIEKEEKTEESADLSAEITILKTDEKGNVFKSSITIDKCTLKKNDQETQPFAKGTVILMDEYESFSINGKALDENLIKAVRLCELNSIISADAEFGTKYRRKVGDSWDVNSQIIADGRKKHTGHEMDKDKITGKASFDKLLKIEGTDCMQISAEYTDTNLTPPPGKRTIAESCIGTIFYKSVLPIDISKPCIELTGQIKLEMVLSRQINPNEPPKKTIIFDRTYRNVKFIYEKP